MCLGRILDSASNLILQDAFCSQSSWGFHGIWTGIFTWVNCMPAWAQEQFLRVKQFSSQSWGSVSDCCEPANISLPVPGRKIFIGAYPVLYIQINEQNKAGLPLNVILTACLYPSTSRNVELFLPCGNKNEPMLGQTYRADFALRSAWPVACSYLYLMHLLLSTLSVCFISCWMCFSCRILCIWPP